MRAEKEVWREILHNEEGDTPVWSLPPSKLASYAFKEKIKRMPGLADKQRKFLEFERGFAFAGMAREFKIIAEEEQVLVIADSKLVKMIRKGSYCGRVELQRKSITLYKSQAEKLELKQIVKNEDLYEIQYDQYDPEFYGCFKAIVGTS